MTNHYLTFTDLATLAGAGFDINLGTRPINVATADRFDWYDFEAVAPGIPGDDRVWRITFYADPDPGQHPWSWSCSDRDHSGHVYMEDGRDNVPSLDEALAALRALPWQPPAYRVTELLSRVQGQVTVANGILTLPDGQSIPLPHDGV